MLQIGLVLHWSGFKFKDGSEKNKFLVVVAARPEKDALLLVATSQQHSRSFAPGCNSRQSYYFIPGGQKDVFGKDTWLPLHEPYQFPRAALEKSLDSKEITVKGNLRVEVANAIRNCMKLSEDVAPIFLDLF